MYSLSKVRYAGASLDGKAVTTRDDVNEKFYGYAM
jgi:lipid-binding SYLF domain-containing protein